MDSIGHKQNATPNRSHIFAYLCAHVCSFLYNKIELQKCLVKIKIIIDTTLLKMFINFLSFQCISETIFTLVIDIKIKWRLGIFCLLSLVGKEQQTDFGRLHFFQTIESTIEVKHKIVVLFLYFHRFLCILILSLRLC